MGRAPTAPYGTATLLSKLRSAHSHEVRVSAERHALEAKRVYPGLSAETIERNFGNTAAEMLTPWLGVEAEST
jgi:hypothetical protein